MAYEVKAKGFLGRAFEAKEPMSALAHSMECLCKLKAVYPESKKYATDISTGGEVCIQMIDDADGKSILRMIEETHAELMLLSQHVHGWKKEKESA